MATISEGVKIERLIQKQVRLWEAERKSGEKQAEKFSKGRGSYIAISRDYGAGGLQIGKRLAKELNWHLFDQEVVEYIATEAKVRRSVVESFDEKIQSEIATWVHTLLNRHALDKEHYLKHLSHVLFSLAQHGNAIFIGRGARFILPERQGLRVKITAPFNRRVQNLMKFHGLDKIEAQKFIEKMDGNRLAFIRRNFHKEADDLAFFDLILNTGFIELDNAVKIIITALVNKLGWNLA
ncbi:MAG: AAA family ATPase [bacterium]